MYEHLTTALRGVLGPEKVVRVSDCPINVGFTPMAEGVPLLDYLRSKYPNRPVAEEIGLLLVHGGSPAVSPYEDRFRTIWKEIVRVQLVRGAFRSIDHERACFDAKYPVVPTLMVESQLQPHQIVGEMWQLVGPVFRHTWTAYSQALEEGSDDAFFIDLGVSPTERTEVEVAVGLGFEHRLRCYQPVCLALWRRSTVGLSFDEFHTQWPVTPERLALRPDG